MKALALSLTGSLITDGCVTLSAVETLTDVNRYSCQLCIMNDAAFGCFLPIAVETTIKPLATTCGTLDS